jgi:hypothetical protein
LLDLIEKLLKGLNYWAHVLHITSNNTLLTFYLKSQGSLLDNLSSIKKYVFLSKQNHIGNDSKETTYSILPFTIILTITFALN